MYYMGDNDHGKFSDDDDVGAEEFDVEFGGNVECEDQAAGNEECDFGFEDVEEINELNLIVKLAHQPE